MIERFWEDVVPVGGDKLLEANSFDGIIFDPYPFSIHELCRPAFEFFESAAKLLKPGGKFTYFSDEPTKLSDGHIENIRQFFPCATITASQIPVKPWPDCEYWIANSILHVVIEKSTLDQANL